MATRRMFSLKIIDTDNFLDMPVSARELYFQLAMRADDDGFVSNPKRIIKMIGSSDDDMKTLLTKQFIIPFASGVCVIKHWKIHNYIQKDRYQETECIEEKKQLKEVNGKYKLEQCIQDVYKMDTQVRKGKVRKGKESKNLDNTSVLSGEESSSEETIQKKETPAEEAREFFTSEEKQEEIIKYLKEKGHPEDEARQEIKKFIFYWTELNKSGTKQRWELEKTFQLKRRLGTWFNNAQKFNNKGVKVI